jgi:hypothetical protein
MEFMDTRQRIFPALPRWVSYLYGVLAVITIPWVIYLGISLPDRTLSTHWDVAWVGVDITIAGLLLLNAYFAYKESKWLIMTGTATSTLLVFDAWFDILTAGHSTEMSRAILFAIFIELPLALLTFLVAMKLVKREHHV